MGEELPGSVETVVVGAGQAGLIMSWHLRRPVASTSSSTAARRSAAAGRIAGTRSSSCRPNWTTGLPGFPTTTVPTPTGTCIATRWSRGSPAYAAAIDAPVRAPTDRRSG